MTCRKDNVKSLSKVHCEVLYMDVTGSSLCPVTVFVNRGENAEL